MFDSSQNVKQKYTIAIICYSAFTDPQETQLSKVVAGPGALIPTVYVGEKPKKTCFLYMSVRMIYFCPLISKTLEKNINKEIL